MRRSRPPSIALLVGLLCLSFGCGREAPKPQQPATESVEPAFDPTAARYVGHQICAECHAERVRDYESTSHHLTLRPPAADDDLAALAVGATQTLLTRDPAVTFRIERRGKDWIESARIVAANGATQELAARIDWVIGSGKLFEGYLHFEGEDLFQLPVGRQGGSREPMNCPGYVDGEARFDRGVLPRCLDCHATYAESRGPDSFAYAPDSFIAGVGCERCHGAASGHVAWHREHADEKEGRRITAPDRLSRERRLDLCGQCHGDPGTLVRPAFSYRPGEDLSGWVVHARAGGAKTFVHTANQVQRLSASACFKASPTLDCLTCHDPHVQERERMAEKARGRCVECHGAEGCKARPGLSEAIRDGCVACHMPRRQVIDTTFSTREDDYLDLVRMTDHVIGVHPLASMQVELDALASAAPARAALEARFLGELRAEAARAEAARRPIEALALHREIARRWPGDTAAAEGIERTKAARRRFETAQRSIDRASRAVQAGDRWSAAAALREAVTADPDHGEAWQDLGRILLDLEDASGALQAFERAVALDPERAEARLGLGTAASSLGRFDRALEAFDAASRLDSEQAPPLPLRARTALGAGRLAEAERDFEAWLSSHPDDAESRAELGLTRILAGDRSAGQELLDLAASQDPESLGVQKARAAALSATGRYAEATRLYEQLAGRSPGDLHVLNSLAALLAAAHRNDEAIDRFFEILSRDPGRVEILPPLAVLLAEAGRKSDAERILADALKADLPDIASRLQVARAALSLGQIDLALAQAGMALETTAGQDPVVLDLMATIQMTAGRWPEARESLDRAIALARSGGQQELLAALLLRRRAIER